MKIALVTDLHAEEAFTTNEGVNPWNNWQVILNDIRSRGIHQLIFLGDIGSKAAHRQFFESLDQSQLKYRVILGNHENFAEVIETKQPKALQDRNEWYWSEEIDGFKSIFLDSSTDTVSHMQLDWLQTELQTEKDILLFMHHPVLQTNTTPQLEFPLKNDQQLIKLLSTHSRPVHLFCGHLHMDDSMTQENIHQIVTPSASIQIKRHSEKAEIDHADFGYRILDLKNLHTPGEVIWFEAGHQM